MFMCLFGSFAEWDMPAGSGCVSKLVKKTSRFSPHSGTIGKVFHRLRRNDLAG
jgi:hypothetical protein